jgi:hypothetical protein
MGPMSTWRLLQQAREVGGHVDPFCNIRLAGTAGSTQCDAADVAACKLPRDIDIVRVGRAVLDVFYIA